MVLSTYSILFICVAFCTLEQLTTGLVCYNCLDCNTVSNTTETQTVADGIGYSCFKIVATELGVSIVTRAAITNCQSSNNTMLGVNVLRYCCTTDRCNDDQCIGDQCNGNLCNGNTCDAGIALSHSVGLTIIVAVISVVLRTMIIN